MSVKEQTGFDPTRTSDYYSGMVIEAKPPAGDFWLDLQKDHPVATLGGWNRSHADDEHAAHGR